MIFALVLIIDQQAGSKEHRDVKKLMQRFTLREHQPGMHAPLTTETPLILNDTLLINRGQLRHCYRHPTDPGVVVKVPSGTRKDQLAANLKEYKGYQDLIRRHGQLNCISHCLGFSATNRGQGLVCECVRNEDGTIAKTIWDIIVYQDDCDLDSILKVTREFCSYLIERDIRLFDLNLKNIALSRQNNGTYRPMALDLKGRFGNNEFIPLSSYIGILARKKMTRRSRQLIERIRYFHANRQSLRLEPLQPSMVRSSVVHMCNRLYSLPIAWEIPELLLEFIP